MPKQTIDYNKTIMYKLVCNDLNVKEIYIGHTTNWKQRKTLHKRDIDKKNDCKNIFIRNNGGWENWSMIMIENYPCNNKLEACKRERELMEQHNNTINTNRPFITEQEKNEYSMEYKIKNKEKLLEYHSNYRKEHKEKIKGYFETNKESIAQTRKEYYEKNKELMKKNAKEYYEKNKEKIKEKAKIKYQEIIKIY